MRPVKAFEHDDGARLNPHRAILPPLAKERAERAERLAFTGIDGGRGEPVDHGQLEIRHVLSGLKRQKRAVAVERHDIDAGQMVEEFPIDDDERLTPCNLDELRILVGLTGRGPSVRRLFEQCDDGPAEVFVHLAETTHDLLRQRDGDDLAPTPELRRSPAFPPLD